MFCFAVGRGLLGFGYKTLGSVFTGAAHDIHRCVPARCQRPAGIQNSLAGLTTHRSAPLRCVVRQASMERSVSFTEVAAHNCVSDCWVVIRGIVYDVTPFMGLHPGGPTVILPVAGKDATAAFEQIGHSQYAREHLETLRVGVLAGGAAEGCEPGGPLLRTATGGMIGLAGLIPIPCSSCGAALPESSDVCYSCKQAPAEACERQQLQLGGRILQPGEVVHGALAAQDQPTTTIPANQPTPKVPAAWQPFWQGGWQAVGCPTCGPTCASPTVHAQLSLEEYVKRGEAAARRDEWSQALDWYHEAIGVINPSTPAEAAASVYTAASNVQRELGKMRSALRFADRGVMACATAAPAHAARGAALEALGLVVDAHAACAEAGRLQPSQAVHAEAAPHGDVQSGDWQLGHQRRDHDVRHVRKQRRV